MPSYSIEWYRDDGALSRWPYLTQDAEIACRMAAEKYAMPRTRSVYLIAQEEDGSIHRAEVPRQEKTTAPTDDYF